MSSKNYRNKMGAAHEAWLADLFGGRQTKGSGNQWRDQMDVRQNHYTMPFAFAIDGKSSLAKSVGVSLAMWDKAVEQSGGEETMLALRFYKNESLEVERDLVVVDAEVFAEILEFARNYADLREA